MSRMIKIVECCDHKEVYGYLEVENVSTEEVQQKIYEIKNSREFLEECPDWCIDDVFERFPAEWNWNFITNSYDDILEI